MVGADVILSFRNILVASPEVGGSAFGLPARGPTRSIAFPVRLWAVAPSMVPARWELGGHAIEPKAVLATNDYHHLRSRALGWRRGDGAAALPGGLAHSGKAPWCHCCHSYPFARVAHQSALSAPPSPNPLLSGHIWTSARAFSRKIVQACEI